jgi:hypothetical protein
MRKRIAISTAVAFLGISFLAGCGGKYDQPVETNFAPPVGFYNYSSGYTGFAGACHMGMTSGNMFVSFTELGEMRAFFGDGDPIGFIEFRQLDSPTVVGVGPRHVAVADTLGTTEVKVYTLSGGDPVLTFHDPDWRQVSALAVDDSANVYVADAARCFIRAYDAAGNQKFGTDLADSGFGSGHVMSPSSICFDGGALLVAEAHSDKKQVQRISISQPQTGIFFSENLPFIASFTGEEGEMLPLLDPAGVASDTDGYIFVLDPGHGKIFRYGADGTPEAVVNMEGSKGPDTLETAISIGTFVPRPGDGRVYCLEEDTGTIHRWNAQ